MSKAAFQTQVAISRFPRIPSRMPTLAMLASPLLQSDGRSVTGDSEFALMFRFVGRILKVLLEFTVDCFLLILLLVAIVLPWRAVVLCRTLGRVKRQTYRGWALSHICAALLDYVAVPSGMVAFLLSPMRTYAVFVVSYAFWRRPTSSSDLLQYEVELRFFWIGQLFVVWIDWIVFVSALLALVHPWGAVELVRRSSRMLLEPGTVTWRSVTAVDSRRHCRRTIHGVWSLWFTLGVCALVSWPFLLLWIVALPIPTRTLPGVRLLREWYLKRSLEPVSLSWIQFYELSCVNFWFGLVDLAAGPFLVVAVLSGTRTRPMCRVLTREPELPLTYKLYGRARFDRETDMAYRNVDGWVMVVDGSQWAIFDDAGLQKLTKRSQRNSDPVWLTRDQHEVTAEVYLDSNGINVLPITYSDVGFPITQEMYKQRCCFWYGREAVLDMALSPFFCVVLLSGYRTHIVRDKICGRAATYSLVGSPSSLRMVALTQAGFLALDLLVSPLLLLLVLTRHRWPSISMTLGRHFNYFNTNFHQAVLMQAGFLALDLLVSPLLLLLLLTRHRWPSIAMTVGRHFNYFSTDFHQAVLMQAGFLALDLLVSPLLLLLLLTRHRWPSIAMTVGRHFNYFSTDLHWAVLMQAGFLALDLLVSPLLLLLLLARHRWPSISTKVGRHFDSSTADLHCTILSQAGALLLDVLMTPGLLLVLVTRYRASPVWAKLGSWGEGRGWGEGGTTQKPRQIVTDLETESMTISSTRWC